MNKLGSIMQPATPIKAAVTTASQEVLRLRDYWLLCSELVKARLTSMVLLTTLVGYFVAERTLSWSGLLGVAVGMGLLAAGGAVLNQWMEREADALMPRTQHRPLPRGRVQPGTALVCGLLMSILGLCVLALSTSALACVLGALALIAYLGVYTPLKRVTWLNTWIGAVPGALPPVVGWAAATGEVSIQAWSLFGIVACWQMPHFFGIAWLYRDEYTRAGFRMLPQVDPDGRRTGQQAVLWTLLLLPLSLVPWAAGLAGPWYGVSSVLAGVAYLAAAVHFARRRTNLAARRLFLASILYLPLLLVSLALDKMR
ncbi:MAG: heme o synthase [Limisphaera sp.]|nr:heme o synthase [Limisphaera sp.]